MVHQGELYYEMVGIEKWGVKGEERMRKTKKRKQSAKGLNNKRERDRDSVQGRSSDKKVSSYLRVAEVGGT